MKTPSRAYCWYRAIRLFLSIVGRLDLSGEGRSSGEDHVARGLERRPSRAMFGRHGTAVNILRVRPARRQRHGRRLLKPC